MAPIRKLNKRVMAINTQSLDGLGLLQAAGQLIEGMSLSLF
jgi:hypothetical protein